MNHQDQDQDQHGDDIMSHGNGKDLAGHRDHNDSHAVDEAPEEEDSTEVREKDAEDQENEQNEAKKEDEEAEEDEELEDEAYDGETVSTRILHYSFLLFDLKGIYHGKNQRTPTILQDR